MTKKKDDELTISDLARMGHSLGGKAGHMAYLTFGGFNGDGKAALKQLRSIERDVDSYRRSIRAVVRNHKRQTREAQLATFRYLAEELGIQVQA